MKRSNNTCPTVIASARGMLALATALLVGCASKEGVEPVGRGTPPREPPSKPAPTTDPTGQPQPDPTPVKRTVITRDPFGNVSHPDNLMWDGDFEWSSPFADQYAWFSEQGAPLEDISIGAECMSGLKCARVEKKKALLGIAVGSSEPLVARVYVRFVDTAVACDSAEVVLATQGVTGSDPDLKLVPVSSDVEGWCSFEASSPPRREQSYLYLKNKSNVAMLIDNATLYRAPKNIAMLPAPPMEGDLIQRLQEIRQMTRSARLPHDGRKHGERERFYHWLAKNPTKESQP